jgi:hypothetical protein
MVPNLQIQFCLRPLYSNFKLFFFNLIQVLKFGKKIQKLISYFGKEKEKKNF